MVHIDLNAPDPRLTPGVDLWEIRECNRKDSRGGTPMLALKLARVSDPTQHMYDNIMLAGGGWGIGKRKLGAFLPADFAGEFDPLDLIGTQVWVETEIQTYEGKDRLAVNVNGLKHGGYQRADDPPAGKTIDEDSVPF